MQRGLRGPADGPTTRSHNIDQFVQITAGTSLHCDSIDVEPNEVQLSGINS